MMSSINFYEYKMIIEQTIINYYSLIGKTAPLSFSSKEHIFYMELLHKYNIDKSNKLYNLKAGNKICILDIQTILANIKSYLALHPSNKTSVIYRLKLNVSSLHKIYKLLKDIFMLTYDKTNTYTDAVKSVHNYIEIWDQTYISGVDTKELTNILEKKTCILFINDPSGKTKLEKYNVPVVLFDERLGEFLGIPQKYWQNLKNFILDCRSNLFLEIMKRWDSILVKLTNCSNETQFRNCTREYTRTKKKMPIWGTCPKFNEKVQTLSPSSIKFKPKSEWDLEYERFKLSADINEID
jgi:hypothetical protein